jgi:hypothetical protein
MLEPPDQQFFTAAYGYVQLQMFHEANEELEKIDPFNRAAPEVLALKPSAIRAQTGIDVNIVQRLPFVTSLKLTYHLLVICRLFLAQT